ncbi:MAG: DNA translocase FtsK 4TM domain-containing protein [Chthonomonas sp.]|nr:DNA translocase FtsK 4TM domain-containing protein [Chthonomonas sp.]
MLIAVGVVMLLALAMGNAGAVGQALKDAAYTVFGRVAWVVPFALAAMGVAFIRGRQAMQITRVSIGIGLLFLCIVGFFARSLHGDWFDHATVVASGGYVGGAVAWALNWALGGASMVGLGALGMIGIVLCREFPLRDFFERFQLQPIAGRGQSEVRVTGREAPDKAVVVNRERMARPSNAAAEPDDETPPTQRLQTRRMPKMTEAVPPTSLTQNSTPEPKEGYTLPPMTLLAMPPSRPKRSAEEMQRNIETLEDTLDQFGIEANVVEVATGPTITRYEIQLGAGVRVGRITALADNIAMNLAARSVRVEAPIPGKAAIGVEVPTTQPSMVSLREVCSSPEFLDHKSRLAFALGQDVAGANRYADLTKMPHLLIGGATNSGKSIGLATIITSLLVRNTPKDLRMVMIDPKRVELSLFDGIPHLMCPVVKDVKEAPGVLRAVWREMDIRYDLFSEKGVRNIEGWNAKASFADRMPYIVVVIDELADMMIQAKAEVETSIVRLAQLARAVGIHLVIATQRPSVDVITGLIKANVPSRIAFAVSSQIDSRTILDSSGAEDLVGKGDMLFLPIDADKPVRMQGCYVSEQEIEDVCKHWKEQELPNYVLKPITVESTSAGGEDGGSGGDLDPLFGDAVRWVVERGQASTSMLQRRFSIGFQRASRLLDLMEEKGIVGPRDGPRPRDVRIDVRDVEGVLGGQGVAFDGPDLGFMDEEAEGEEREPF